MAGNTPGRAGTRHGLKHILTPHINIFSIKQIKNCKTCGTHFRQLFKTHELCSQCYHGIKNENATMIALKHRGLAHVTE